MFVPKQKFYTGDVSGTPMIGSIGQKITPENIAYGRYAAALLVAFIIAAGFMYLQRQRGDDVPPNAQTNTGVSPAWVKPERPHYKPMPINSLPDMERDWTR